LAIDRSEIRKALGNFATGVSVITTRVGGQFYGLTANSFASVSLAPPVLLFCIARSRQCYDAFADTCSFTVNVLNSRQRGLSDRFATSGDDKWRELRYVEDDLGNVMFPDAAAVFSCDSLRGEIAHERLRHVSGAEDHDPPVVEVVRLEE